MTPTDLAALHALCFTSLRPWTEREFQDLIDSPLVFLILPENPIDIGFALGRVIADEAELLTIAVAPKCQRSGLGRALMKKFHQTARNRAANTVFLEVADRNSGARALYESCGYTEIGRRKDYYNCADGTPQDAIVMSVHLGSRADQARF